MAKSFSGAFTHFLTPSDETIRVALTSGFVVLDTNVLLSAYRFAPKAREELLSTLRTLGNRVWVPHQVGLEFHRNRLEVMAERRATYDAVLSVIDSHKQTAQTDLEGKIRNLSNQAALTDEERDRLLMQLQQVFGSLRKSVKRLSDDHAPDEIESDDPILSSLQGIIGDRVGDEFDEQNRADALTEAERRAKEKIPPGFKDAGKSTGGHGDYFVWRQTLDEANRRSTSHLVFVTGDRKEDWYLKAKGKIIAAQPELAEEVHRWCGAQLVLMSTQTLLFHATKYLNANVSSETIRQAGELPTADYRHHERQELASRSNELQARLHYTVRNLESAQDEISRINMKCEDIEIALQQAASQSEKEGLLLERHTLEAKRRTIQKRLQEAAEYQAMFEHKYRETLWAMREIDRQLNS
ncbi:PIN-like domain-containing protein [Micromonospora sp. RTGN7]|uniref:PIN-like domain-containing protein n=1 Tax=Micromonospora sp. RTGN7 TaxID=3016526 RepID=UPI0029FF0109|nr:PIN domain-containing protein [Micromonospora sp. RTGN7]